MVKGTAREKALQLQMFRKTEFAKHLKSADPKRFIRLLIYKSRESEITLFIACPQLVANIGHRESWSATGLSGNT